LRGTLEHSGLPSQRVRDARLGKHLAWPINYNHRIPGFQHAPFEACDLHRGHSKFLPNWLWLARRCRFAVKVDISKLVELHPARCFVFRAERSGWSGQSFMYRSHSHVRGNRGLFPRFGHLNQLRLPGAREQRG